jgi:K(+)-stimulated pyrophosphate-energized sodium pump
LFAAYSTLADATISLTNPLVIVGLLLGAMTAFYFASLTIGAVEHAAFKMVKEVRRQFKDIKGLLKGKAEPDSNRCVEISTKAALRQMILPALLSVIMPLLVGLLLGVDALGGLVAGVITVGALLAITMSNAGGAWDNAKKKIEEGLYGGKKGAGYGASIVGDTVGDPMKDTAGPSLNILIKVVSTVAIIFIPLFLKYGALIKLG